MIAWREYANPALKLSFQYPVQTPRGEIVLVYESRPGDGFRVHLIAPESKEVYFEVTWYPQLSALEEYKRHREALLGQFGDAVKISPLTSDGLSGLAAWHYLVEWAHKKRQVYLLPPADGVHRILFDPVSPVNLDILATVRLNV